MKSLAHDEDAVWAAITEPSRRLLIELLSIHGSLSASRLALNVPFSRQAVAKHLEVLEKSGIVHHWKQGKEVLFALQEDRLLEVSKVMRETSSRWEQRLQRLKTVTESI